MMIAVIFVIFASISGGLSLADGESCEKSRVTYTLAHEEQCDAYFRCEKGVLSEQLCDDGLVYHETDQRCDMPLRVDCSTRPLLQPAQGSGNCPRLNGLYHHPEFCDQYFYCHAGLPTLITCPVGLIYDVKTGVCEFPDVALRAGCMPEQVLGFQCPSVSNTTEMMFGDHLRFAKTDDCRYFYKCLKNGYPRLAGCELGNVFNDQTGMCEPAEKVAKCKNYYSSKASAESD